MIRIVQIKNKFIFPIFKNGKSSIEYYAQTNKCKWFFNEQCKKADLITVYIRHPQNRFISGVHSFIEFEKRKNNLLDYDTMLYAIQNYGVTNKHFEPQFFWIKRLAKYYTGPVRCVDVSWLLNLIPNRDKPGIPDITQEQRNKISNIHLDNFLYDQILFEKYIDTTIEIHKLIEDIENEMSSS